MISIHAPHARSDGYHPYDLSASLVISIHAPHARSDFRPSDGLVCLYNFNPRSSCEERLERSGRVTSSGLFQSTLLMRGATRSGIPSIRCFRFQSTLLMRGATACLLLSRISPQHFNPRSSCEERLTAISAAMPTVIFQSTLLMRGATPFFHTSS